jgi:hypothetical protein
MRTALIPVSSFAVLALVVVGTLGVTHKSAEAQELAERAMARAVQIPVEMREKIEAQLKADMMETLKEAYAAPDLRILTREEYEKEAQFTMATGTPATAAFAAVRNIHTVNSDVAVSGEAGSFKVSHTAPLEWEGAVEAGAEPMVPGKGPVTVAFRAARAMPIASDTDVTFTRAATDTEFTAGTMVAGFDIKQPVKYLRYTDPDGRKVTLGLDESDTPVFRIEELIATDIQHMPDGSIGIQGKVLHQIEVHTQNMDGGFGTAGAVRVGASEE